MRAREFLSESVTFSPAKLEDGYWTDNPFRGTEHDDCEICDGSGRDEDYGDVDGNCAVCRGSGKKSYPKLNAPSMNVANGNARAILDMLGIESDELSGHIDHKDLPKVMQKLVKLKNTDVSGHTKDTTVSGGDTRVDRSGDVPQITRGPTMYDMGRTEEQVRRYVDSLIEIVKFAQENGAAVMFA